MICVTGDLHGDITRFRSPALKKLRRGDALIITGDFGCIWDGSKKEKKMLKKLGKKKWIFIGIGAAALLIISIALSGGFKTYDWPGSEMADMLLLNPREK